MPARKTDKTSKPAGRKPAKRTAAQGKAATTLPESMVTGKASPAKAAVGDKPVFAYIASLPQPQRGIAERIDALAAKTLPGLQRSVKWGMSYYGVGDGWCFCCGGFAGHVKLMFVNGAALDAGTAGDAGGDGQVYAGRGARISGRPRRTPDRGVDETSRGRARCRGEEAVGPRGGVQRTGVSRRAWLQRGAAEAEPSLHPTAAALLLFGVLCLTGGRRRVSIGVRRQIPRGGTMADSEKSGQVTRREFYGALVVIWFYIWLVIGDLLRIERRWTTAILWLASLLMFLAYTVISLRAGRSDVADGKKGLPPSDRVKEIARDPARKIEAIKAYREETGAGLAEAKDAIEAYINSL